MRVAPLVAAGAITLLGACGSSGNEDAVAPEPESSPAPAAADATAAPVPTAENETDLETDDEVAGETTLPADPAPTVSPVDPSQLDPGSAVVVVDGRELRFARGDSIFDVCDLAPDFDLGDVELDVVEGPEEGGPHFDFHYSSDYQTLVVAFLPDTGFVAGAGEETDPYVENFGVVSPPMDPIDVGDGVAAGTITMVNVFTGDDVQASIAIRCE